MELTIRDTLFGEHYPFQFTHLPTVSNHAISFYNYIHYSYANMS